MKITLMKTMAAAVLVAGLSWNGFAASKSVKGTLNVTVMDENGALVMNAPVYIYGDHKTKFVGGKEIPGTATMDLPAGTYRISSAIMRKTGEYFDRFASPEAFVEVVDGDNTVVTLRLRAMDVAVASLNQPIGLNY